MRVFFTMIAPSSFNADQSMIDVLFLSDNVRKKL